AQAFWRARRSRFRRQTSRCGAGGDTVRRSVWSGAHHRPELGVVAQAVSRLFAAVGAFGCGKTTTLRYLAERYGYRLHQEAHNDVLAMLGDRMAGHPPDQGYTPIDDPWHFCPMCRPVAFCDMVLARQAEIERGAVSGDLVEHGWLDAVEYCCRNAGILALPP